MSLAEQNESASRGGDSKEEPCMGSSGKAEEEPESESSEHTEHCTHSSGAASEPKADADSGIELCGYIDVVTRCVIPVEEARANYQLYTDRCPKNIRYRCDHPHSMVGRKGAYGFVNIKYRAARDTHYTGRCQRPGSRAARNTPRSNRKVTKRKAEGAPSERPVKVVATRPRCLSAVVLARRGSDASDATTEKAASQLGPAARPPASSSLLAFAAAASAATDTANSRALGRPARPPVFQPHMSAFAFYNRWQKLPQPQQQPQQEPAQAPPAPPQQPVRPQPAALAPPAALPANCTTAAARGERLAVETSLTLGRGH